MIKQEIIYIKLKNLFLKNRKKKLIGFNYNFSRVKKAKLYLDTLNFFFCLKKSLI